MTKANKEALRHMQDMEWMLATHAVGRPPPHATEFVNKQVCSRSSQNCTFSLDDVSHQLCALQKVVQKLARINMDHGITNHSQPLAAGEHAELHIGRSQHAHRFGGVWVCQGKKNRRLSPTEVLGSYKDLIYMKLCC